MSVIAGAGRQPRGLGRPGFTDRIASFFVEQASAEAVANDHVEICECSPRWVNIGVAGVGLKESVKTQIALALQTAVGELSVGDRYQVSALDCEDTGEDFDLCVLVVGPECEARLLELTQMSLRGRGMPVVAATCGYVQVDELPADAGSAVRFGSSLIFPRRFNSLRSRRVVKALAALCVERLSVDNATQE